jgi:hypothetical protein
LIAACRPGNTGADLYRAWENSGNPDPGVLLAHGLGLGAEPPLIGLGRGSDATIDVGMVLSVQSWVTEEGIGGCLERGTVRIGDIFVAGGEYNALRKVVMASHRTTFNHIGLWSPTASARGGSTRGCSAPVLVELELPTRAPKSLMLAPSIGVRATYLVLDGLVLELIDYSKREAQTGGVRVMDEVGLTHMSLSVSDLSGVLTKVEEFGGSLVKETVTGQFAMIRDPDGQLIELLPDTWLANLPPRP